ncbi:hypothetical protein J1N35_030536 [Gossypium stocksii]|uniref:Reverse transcriptase domain-containing protein n=1 Tax=Gossypium stocksii TaxID=47602 RepID=A0A9D3V145_9ROSI|nr:hypothetical protein J1N35_030536 [Gossypium stocksii]
MLDKAVEKGLFQYYPQSKKVKLTHLSFADDLLIFAKGNLESAVGVQCVLRQFYCFSGLQLNSSKSDVFSSGISDAEVQHIQQVTGFKLGNFPVRYLGVPLV